VKERMTAAELRAYQREQAAASKRNKYSAQPTVVDGIRFDSKREAKRWGELRLLEQAGKIADLKRQVAIYLQGVEGPLLTRTGRRMRITVDFAYLDLATGLIVYEDAKGKPTRDYEVRRANAAASGIDIREV